MLKLGETVKGGGDIGFQDLNFQSRPNTFWDIKIHL